MIDNFHNAFYILLTLIGLDAKAEAHTSDGRIDLLIQTPKYIYVIELKYDASAEEALRHLSRDARLVRPQADGRRVFRIGVSFSSETRRIGDWKIQ